MNPVHTMVGLNHAVALGTACAMVVGSAIMFRLFEEQARAFVRPFRATGDRRHGPAIVDGPELDDHYGHRHTDVDVEHV